MDTVEDVVAAALGEFEGRDCDVTLLAADGEPQIQIYARLAAADPVDEDGEGVALVFRAINGAAEAGRVTLREPVSAEWCDVKVCDPAGEPLPSSERYLAIELDGDLELQLGRL
jgi:hypothetical protein